jgi:hypothetical protein
MEHLAQPHIHYFQRTYVAGLSLFSLWPLGAHRRQPQYPCGKTAKSSSEQLLEQLGQMAFMKSVWGVWGNAKLTINDLLMLTCFPRIRHLRTPKPFVSWMQGEIDLHFTSFVYKLA